MATIVSGGRAIQVNNLTLSATDDTQVGFSQPVNSLVIKCRTTVDIQVRDSRNAAIYFTIPAGTTLSIDLVGNEQQGVVLPTNVWLRSTSGSVVAEIIGVYGG